MFEVTEKASEMIKGFLKNQNTQHSVRITMQVG
jgi:Fe-S cluster assembly iron-binding protein IscA